MRNSFLFRFLCSFLAVCRLPVRMDYMSASYRLYNVRPCSFSSTFMLEMDYQKSWCWGLVMGFIVLLALPAQAQQANITVLEESERGVTYEITASWPQSLRTVLDARGTTALDLATVRAMSHGLGEMGEHLFLPSLAAPNVQLLASDFDEVFLGRGTDAELEEALDGPAVAVTGIGTFRKKPSATLHAKLVTYDPERQMLRRYRRMVVAVTYPRGAATVARKATANPHVQVTQSVLADGAIYKIPITTAGVYRIDRSFLSNLPGLGSPDAIDPSTVKVYTNGGVPVPAANSAPRLADLMETPVQVQGGGDGNFSGNDAVLFYANGTTGWQYEATEEAWSHYVHPFDSTNYVFIKISETPSASVGSASFPNFSDASVREQVTARYFRDFDEFMWSREAGTGHTWVSNRIFGGGSRVLLENVVLPGLQSGTVQYVARPAVGANPRAALRFMAGGSELESVLLNAASNSAELPVASVNEVTFEQTINAGQSLTLSMELQNQINNPSAVIDWVRVFYPRSLTADNGVLQFATPAGESGRFEFVLRGFSQPPQVWDITTPGEVRALGIQASGNTYRVQIDVVDDTQPREVIAFASSAIRSLDANALCPDDDGASCRVPTQNLHGMAAVPEFIIVTPPIFEAQANELADRRRQEGLSVEVVLVEQIFNEFSGGQVDPRGIRDFFRFVYDQGPEDEPTFRYALLFGDGHFNYRRLGGEAPVLTNWIPPFETEESFDPERSYTSDDYLGLLDEDEGLWPYTRTTHGNSLDEQVDIGIGRLPVQTVRDAEAMIEKIKHYEDPATYGPWRQRYLFIADDGFNGLAAELENTPDLHTQNTDVVAERVAEVAPGINQIKVYGVSYERQFLGASFKLPEAKNDLLRGIRDGALVVNYSGHGGEFGLAQEELFTDIDAQNLTNFDKLSIFITATCSFGRWDLMEAQSGAEELLLNPNGGAVALMTTVRTVYTRGGTTTTLNVGLNYELNEQLFEPDEDGLPRRLGEALLQTKNVRVGYEGNNRKFNLLGDPTLRIGLPPRETAVTRVNGAPLEEQVGQIKALDTVTIEGEVLRSPGQVDDAFNGTINLAVYDAERQVAIPDEYVDLFRNRPYYVVQEDLLWRGRADVANGRFSATFVVPKDISYSNLPGRISVYGISGGVHAGGLTKNVIIGGTADNPPNDSDGPEIELFIDSERFVDGGLASPRPQVLVKLFDESGINTVGAGVGHEMLLVVDDDEQNAINIGNLYESDPNSFRSGQVVYAFEEDLTEGPHTLSVRAWDVLNNSGTAALDLLVADSEALRLANVFNYPNPTTGPTRFVFEHNQPLGAIADVQIRIYTITGRPVVTLERDGLLLSGGPEQIVWDGLDDDFDRLAPGVYLYKVRVEVEGMDGARHVSEQLEKLAIVR